MAKNTIKKSIDFPKETFEKLEKLSIKRNQNISEVIRQLVNKGLNLESSREDIDFIADIIRTELNSIYRLEDIKEILDKQTNRLAINMFLKIIDESDEDKFDEILEKSMRNGVNYMQKKDFVINDFLQDTDNLKNVADEL